MDSDGGGVATAVTSRRLTSHHSTLRDTFIAADLSDAINREFNHNSSIVNSTTSPRRVSNVTLGAVLNSDRKSPPPANIVVRTLLEVIRNDETLTPRSAGGSPNGKKTWKSFKDRLKLKRNQNFSQNQNPNSRNWTSSLPVPQSDVIPSSRSSLGEVMANRNSLRSSSLRRVDTVPADDLTLREVDSGGSPRGGSSFRLSAALAAEREQTRRRLSRELDEGNRSRNENEEIEVSPRGDEEEDDDDDEDGGGIPNLGPPANQPLRMSLMDLLEETDRQAGISGPTYRLDDEEEEEEEEVEVEVEEEVQDVGKGEFSCCVCMVRHKGAAFIPCGHTFCRLCSRELFVQRGNCPLCNNFILEILDIF